MVIRWPMGCVEMRRLWVMAMRRLKGYGDEEANGLW